MKPSQETLDYLYGLQFFGMKLGLSNIRALLRFCGNPQSRFLSVHVAGTNGKGSTSSMIAAILQSAGYRTGLYTSPHITLFNERIRINGKMIADDDLVRYARQFKPKIDSLKATFFEATTAIAFKYFADQKVEVAVVETGLGGRLDATNVLLPAVSVITPIGKDHIQQLGRTLRKIAFEKGGIIKPRTPCLSSVQRKEALAELRKLAKKRRAPFRAISAAAIPRATTATPEYQVATFRTECDVYRDIRVPLLGAHQLANAALAIAAVETLRGEGVAVQHKAFGDGLEKLRMLTGLRGRFEILRADPLVVLDVGHNPSGILAAVDALRNYRRRNVVLIFGVMGDKDYRTMIRTLARLRPRVLAVRPEMERALPAETIAGLFRQLKCPAESVQSVRGAVQKALRVQKKNDLVLICGSHYIAAEALAAFRTGRRPKKS